MANNRESGKAVNASNFISKVDVIDQHKLEYQPSNTAIKLETLLPQRELAREALARVSAANLAKTAAVNNRTNAYGEMETKATRAISMLSSSEASEDEIKQGKLLLKKFKSIRISDVPGEEEIRAKAAEKGEAAKIPKKISNSQQGHIQLLAHFRDIIIFLKTVTAYQPKETELKTDAMDALADSIDILNTEKNKKADELTSAIANREKVMNAEPNGAYYINKKLMDYVAASHGKSSSFYKELLKYPVRK